MALDPARDTPGAPSDPPPLPPRALGQTPPQAAGNGRAAGCVSCQGGRGGPVRRPGRKEATWLMKPTWGNARLERWPDPRPSVTRMISHPVLRPPGALVASPCPRGTVHRFVCEHLLCAAHSADALGDEGEDWCRMLALDSVQGNC